MPKQKMMDLLHELIIDCKRSDRKLANVLHASQPTITRMRKNLENSGFIREYTIMPALEKMGFEIVAMNFLSIMHGQEPIKEIQKWASENNSVILASHGEGLAGKTVMLVSVHKDFTDFSAFSHALKDFLGPKMSSTQSFLFSLRAGVLKDFSFRNLE